MKKSNCLLVIAVLLSACVTYSSHSVSYRSPKEYRNYQETYGFMVGAESFADKKNAEKAFGFDVRAAGLLPVQVVINNKSGQGVDVVSGQTFLIDGSNRYWKLLTHREAVDKVKKAAEAGIITSVAGKGASWSSVASALMGPAIRVVSARDAASVMVKSDVSNSGGDVAGGVGKAVDDTQREVKIAEDIREKGVEGKILSAESLASGFMFFPGEVSAVSEIRMQIKFRDTGRIQTLNLKLD